MIKYCKICFLPSTKLNLYFDNDGLASDEGICFPVARGIPFFRPKDAKYAINPAP